MSCLSSHPRETEPEMRIRVQAINYGSASASWEKWAGTRLGRGRSQAGV